MCLYAYVANIDKLVLKSRFLQSYGIAFYRLIWYNNFGGIIMLLTRDMTFTVVCNIRTPIGDNRDRVGTGIFINKDNNAYLVTAAHVANETNTNSYIVYCDAQSNPIARKLTVLNSTLSWQYHPIADICCLELDLDHNMDLLSNRCFPYDHIEPDATAISRDIELTCVGFPNGLGVGGKFTPFTFRSYFSSGIVEFLRFDTQTQSEFLCLENPSVGGDSGGPVFDLGYKIIGSIKTSTGGKTRLFGIMHGTLQDNTGGKIAAVTPIHYLTDLI